MNAALAADDRALIRDLTDPSVPLERIAESRGVTLAAVRERLRAPAVRAELSARRALTGLRASLLADEARLDALARLRRHAAEEPETHAASQDIPWRAREASRKAAALLLKPQRPTRQPGRRFARGAPPGGNRPSTDDSGGREATIAPVHRAPDLPTALAAPAMTTSRPMLPPRPQGRADPFMAPRVTAASVLAATAGLAVRGAIDQPGRARDHPLAPT